MTVNCSSGKPKKSITAALWRVNLFISIAVDNRKISKCENEFVINLVAATASFVECDISVIVVAKKFKRTFTKMTKVAFVGKIAKVNFNVTTHKSILIGNVCQAQNVHFEVLKL